MSAIGRTLKRFRGTMQITDLADQLFADDIRNLSIASPADLAQHIQRMEQGDTYSLGDDLQTKFIECCANRLSGGSPPRKALIERKLTKAILKDGGDDFFD